MRGHPTYLIHLMAGWYYPSVCEDGGWGDVTVLLRNRITQPHPLAHFFFSPTFFVFLSLLLKATLGNYD